VANTANIGADLGAIASGVELLSESPATVSLIPLGDRNCLGRDRDSLSVLRYIPKGSNAGPLCLILSMPLLSDQIGVRPLGVRSFPRFTSTAALSRLVALFGTTVSPYLFFWPASEEIEELHQHHKRRGTEPDIMWAQLDVDLGMLPANAVFYFIVLTTAATLIPRAYMTSLQPGTAACRRSRRDAVRDWFHWHRLAFDTRGVRRICRRGGVRLA
jgi:hypothetical protein